MMKKRITGIQQIGIGVENVNEAWTWYRKHFGMDIKVFEESAVAKLMLPYTEGKERARHAVLALNMQGGGGFEIWQHTGKKPERPKFEIELGDIGIFCAKIKSSQIQKAFDNFKSDKLKMDKGIQSDPSGQRHFMVTDPYGNYFQVVESNNVYMPTHDKNGGIYGAIIGVSSIEKAMVVYNDILGYDEIVYDETGIFDDLSTFRGGSNKIRRVLLKHSKERSGGFSPMLGPTQIELIQKIELPARKIYEGRIWGDPGFIHICFDTIGMQALKSECESKGFPFTVDSANSFDMGEAAGHFTYISDPDGTPVEFVETHKLPILKKLGWYMNLKDRNPEKSLPRWMMNTLKWKRVK